MTDLFEKFEFGEAGRLLYRFIWDDYCDWYIEMSKEVLQGENEVGKKTTRKILAYVLDNVLRLLHPVMPFVTEEIWQNVPHQGDSTTAAYPVADASHIDEAAEEAMEKLIELIRGVRNVRAEMNTIVVVQKSSDAVESE